MIYQLVFLAIPKDPMLLRILAKTLVKTTAWRLRGHPRIVRSKKTKCFKKPRKKRKMYTHTGVLLISFLFRRYFQKWNFTQNVHPHRSFIKFRTGCKLLTLIDLPIQDTTIKKLPSYLVPAFFAAIKIGCRIEAYLCKFMRPLQRAPRFLALQSAFLDNPAVRFDSDSFSIGINNHASRCMANVPHLFEDLQHHRRCGGGKGDRRWVSH